MKKEEIRDTARGLLSSGRLLANIEADAAKNGNNYDFDHVSNGDWSSFAQIMGSIAEIDELMGRLTERKHAHMTGATAAVIEMGAGRHPSITKDRVEGSAISVNWEMKIVSLTSPMDFMDLAAKTLVDGLTKNRRDSDG